MFLKNEKKKKEKSSFMKFDCDKTFLQTKFDQQTKFYIFYFSLSHLSQLYKPVLKEHRRVDFKTFFKNTLIRLI